MYNESNISDSIEDNNLKDIYEGYKHYNNADQVEINTNSNNISNNNTKKYTGMKIDKSKNKGYSQVQITAEQIIRASQAHVADEVEVTNTVFDTPEELEEYKAKKRKKLEEQTQRNRYNISAWFKYADWEEHIGEYKRARNVYERAIEVDYKNVSLWLRWADMEIKAKFINHARNVFERAIKLLPRVDQFWFKYAYMEEMLGNYIGVREIYKVWMTWKPGENAWISYSKFEERMGEIDKAREVMYKYIEKNSDNVDAYIKTAKYEEKLGNFNSARTIYETALSDLGEKALNENFFINFIKFEIRMKEIDRARVLFNYSIDNISKLNANGIIDLKHNELANKSVEKLKIYYAKFEKMYGNEEKIDLIILERRRNIYEDDIKNNYYNYDVWFDYIKLEENYLNELIINNSSKKESQIEVVRDLYERAISNVPEIKEKKYWKRYIFLWINYAVFEELLNNNSDISDKIYKLALSLIPHKIFTFSKMWILYSQYLIRKKQINEHRLLLGKSIGFCPNEKIIRYYIDVEIQLGEIDRCRKLYEKLIQCFTDNPNNWIKYAEFEVSLDENERVTAILDNALSLENLKSPEDIWKFYIEYETINKNYDKVRKLYENLINKTNHVKVYNSFAKFEENNKDYLRCRIIYEKANNYYKLCKNNDDRADILYNWLEFEERISMFDNVDNLNILDKIKKQLPQKVVKRKVVNDENNQNKEYEEYYDYIFPDDEDTTKNSKLLEKAKLYLNKSN